MKRVPVHLTRVTTSSACTGSIYRRLRRLRLTAIVYACSSLCGVLLFLNFNEEVKRLILQKPMGQTEVTIGRREHDTTSAEEGLNSSPDPTGFTTSVDGDENSVQSKVRHKLNSVAAGSASQVPKGDKDWFMWEGTRFPTVETSASKLWSEENPSSDRIVEQLMYVTEEDVRPPSSSFFPKLGRLFGGDSSTSVRSVNSSTPPSSVVRTDLKTILLYYGLGTSWGSHVLGGRHVFVQQKCPVNACRLTGSRAQMHEADVVVFKDVFMTPKLAREQHQLWVMYMLECPLNTQNFVDKNVFNLTATYRHDSDIVTPYEKWVYYDHNVKGIPQDRNYASGKTKKVAWFVSNCVAKNNRLEYARELGKYIEVDIYGACGTHSCSRATAKQCFDLLSKTYKFYLAFENSNCRDYISEKFFVNGLGNNVLPIVMGAHPDDYRRAAPYKSYIHVDDFPSPKELGQFLQKLDEDDNEYNSYFAWKGTGEFVNTHFFCRLCAMVHYAHRQGNQPRLYKDFNDWWKGPDVCTRRSWRNQPDIFNTSQVQTRGT